MKAAVRALAVLCAALCSSTCGAATERSGVGSTARRSETTPLLKVLSMMDDMLVKGKQDKQDEKVAFAEFSQWCDSTRKATKDSIADAVSKIEQLEADRVKAQADAEALAQAITELEGSISAKEAELAKASNLREEELATYESTHKDFTESIDAIARAISVLKAKSADVPQSLLQLQQSSEIPARARTLIAAFLEVSQGATEDAAAPEANAYEFQSGGVVSMLEKLKLKFEDQKLVLEKAELSSKANFEMLEQKLTDDIKFEKSEVERKTAKKAEKIEAAASAEGDLDITKKGKAEDEKKLADTLAECNAKSQEFEKNQVLRAEEIKAIEKAVSILQSDEVSGSADKYLPTFVQLGSSKARSLLQLRGGPSGPLGEARLRAAALLRAHAQRSGSTYLALVATHVQADPFIKVKKMIKDLIVKLMEEANAEADSKAYCDTELSTNALTRKNKESEVASLTAEIEMKQAESAQLAGEIKDLSGAMAELRKELAESTKLRGEEKAENTQVIADAKAAQAAVERATQVLKDYYGSVSEASLVQSQSGGTEMMQEMTQAAKAPYQGMQSEGGGIVGFLEVVLSDFARLEAETSSAEDEAQQAYEKFTAESNEDTAVKEAEMSHKEKNKSETDTLIMNLGKELELTQGELDAALAYYEKLKPTCVDQGLSYEDRVKMREEEIQSLKEALAILQQEELA